MRRSALALAVASLGGLAVGAAVSWAEHLRQFALASLFVQTMIAVGGLAEARAKASPGWAWRMLVKHHVVSSIPLLFLGIVLGLDTWLGAGTYLLGAVPPAIALPSYAAACGGHVRPVIQFCILGYAMGVVVTPILVITALGTSTRVDSMMFTLLLGLVLPAILGTLCQPWLQRVPRRASFAVVSGCVLVLMLGMGADLRHAVSLGMEHPGLLWAALTVALGRCVWGGALGWWWARGSGLRLESALAGGGKNAVLAAVLAAGAAGRIAALPALLGLVAEALLLVAVSFSSARTRPNGDPGIW